MIFVFLFIGQVFIQTATAVIDPPPAPQPITISIEHGTSKK